MSQVLGAFGLLEFTMLQPIVTGRAFWNLRPVYFFIFPFFFSLARAYELLDAAHDCISVQTPCHLTFYQTLHIKPNLTYPNRTQFERIMYYTEFHHKLVGLMLISHKTNKITSQFFVITNMATIQHGTWFLQISSGFLHRCWCMKDTMSWCKSVFVKM
jgi:hypothetical protein